MMTQNQDPSEDEGKTITTKQKQKHSGYIEGQTVHTSQYIRQDSGDWPTEQDGTLLDYVGDGEWTVYVPGHGQVTVSEQDFE